MVCYGSLVFFLQVSFKGHLFVAMNLERTGSAHLEERGQNIQRVKSPRKQHPQKYSQRFSRFSNKNEQRRRCFLQRISTRRQQKLKDREAKVERLLSRTICPDPDKKRFIMCLDIVDCQKIYPLLHEDNFHSLFVNWINKPTTFLRVPWEVVMQEKDEVIQHFFPLFAFKCMKSFVTQKESLKTVSFLKNLLEQDVFCDDGFKTYLTRQIHRVPTSLVVKHLPLFLKHNQKEFFDYLTHTASGQYGYWMSEIFISVVQTVWARPESLLAKTIEPMWLNYQKKERNNHILFDVFRREAMRVVSLFFLFNNKTLPLNSVMVQISRTSFVTRDPATDQYKRYTFTGTFLEETATHKDRFFEFTWKVPTEHVYLRASLSSFLPTLYKRLPNSLVLYLLTFLPPYFSRDRLCLFPDFEKIDCSEHVRDPYADDPFSGEIEPQPWPESEEEGDSEEKENSEEEGN